MVAFNKELKIFFLFYGGVSAGRYNILNFRNQRDFTFLLGQI